MLTITIPTYNREKELINTLQKLSEAEVFTSDDVIVRIIDNASNYCIEEMLNLRGYKEKLELIRNENNVGLGANIMKCFEYCTTDWLWILGDDDIPNSDSLVNIMTELQNADNCTLAINFSSLHGLNKIDRHVQDITSLVESTRFSNLLFISTNIYSSKMMKNYSEQGYSACFFHMPHTSMMLNAFQNIKESKIKVSSLAIIEANSDVFEISWSRDFMFEVRKYYKYTFPNLPKDDFQKLNKFVTQGYDIITKWKLGIKNLLNRN